LRNDAANLTQVSPPLPDGLPSWITPEAIEDTVRTLSPHYGHPLTSDEAIEVLLNLGGLFAALDGDRP
jgi:hypothetical protein